MLCCPLSLHGTEYRVSSAAQISATLGIARPGDTLTMTNGIWSNASIMFAGYGTASTPILLRAESYGGVVLSGTSTLRISGRNLVVDGLLFRNGTSPSGAVIEFQGSNGESDSCRLTNCSIIAYNPADLTVDYKWISLYGTRNRVDHCYIQGKKHQGSTLVVWVDPARANFHQIDHNYFGPRPRLPGNGGETIRVGTGAVSEGNSCTIVEYNYFLQCNGDAEFVSNKSGGNIYRYNTFVGCQGTLSMRQGSGATIEGNFIFGNHLPGTGGIRLMGTDHKVYNNYVSGVDDSKSGCALAMMNGTLPGVSPNYDQVKRAVVAFNTFVDNNYTIGFGVNNNGGVLQPDSCLIANNVFSNNNTKPIITVYTVPTNVTWQGNICFGSSLGITQPPGITFSDPKMGLAADGLWRPTSLSPVVNAAVGSFPYVVTDMDGQLRDATPDVGADEISFSPVTRRPLTPADVGPPSSMITAVMEPLKQHSVAPQAFELLQNYPNPFSAGGGSAFGGNPTTAISYRLSVVSDVKLRVMDALGREVAALVTCRQEAGFYTVRWDASNMPSGMYFCQMLVSDGRAISCIETRKMLLLK